MAAVTLLGTATFNTTSGTKTVTATPAVGDLIVIVTAHSGNTSTAAPTDNNSSGTYTLVNSAVKVTSADTMRVWVRDALITSATSTVFTHAPGTSTGGGLAVLKITGMSLTGASAIVRSAIQSNIASGTPAPVLAATPSINNAIVTAVFNGTSPAGITARTNYTRSVNLGYSTPTSGLAVAHDDAGETSATITWGSSSATAFCSIAVEINAAVTHATTGTLTGQGSTVVGAADRQSNAVTHATTGALAGQGSTVTGSAARLRAFATSGTLSGQGSTLAGSAVYNALHGTTGALAGQNATLAGTAARTRAHATTGVLSASSSAIAGSAARVGAPVAHATSGALEGPGTTLAGAAARTRLHATSGILAGPGAIVVGTASQPVMSSGVLVGPGATLAGSATRIALYPDPADVRAGVVYGPGGIYTGTLTATGSGVVYLRRR